MEQNQLIKNASYVSVVTGLLIFVVKAFGWAKSDSMSLFASLVDSLLDISSSLLNMAAIHIALTPPDDNHRFGHNKVQDLAIFGQAIFFISSGAFTLFIAIKKLLSGHYVIAQQTGVVTMLICMILGLLLLIYQSYVIKKTDSNIIKSDRVHYIADIASNLAVILSIIGSRYFYAIDSIFAVLISTYIIYSAVELFRTSVKNLVDEEFSQEDKDKVLQVLKNNSDILGVHNLKTRHAGNKAFIQCHIDLDPTISLIAAHTISENICQELLAIFPSGEVIIHQDPLGYDDEIQHRENI
jgi:ferrous-iron efflux pump FieF